MDNQTAAVLGGIVGWILGSVVGVFLGALLVQVATRWVAGFKPKYGKACLASLVAYVVCFGLSFIVSFGVTIGGGKMGGEAMVFMFIASFFAQSGFYSFMLKDPDGHGIGYGKACLVSVIQYVILGLAIGLVVLLVLGALQVAK